MQKLPTIAARRTRYIGWWVWRHRRSGAGAELLPVRTSRLDTTPFGCGLPFRRGHRRSHHRCRSWAGASGCAACGRPGRWYRRYVPPGPVDARNALTVPAAFPRAPLTLPRSGRIVDDCFGRRREHRVPALFGLVYYYPAPAPSVKFCAVQVCLMWPDRRKQTVRIARMT